MGGMGIDQGIIFASIREIGEQVVDSQFHGVRDNICREVCRDELLDQNGAEV